MEKVMSATTYEGSPCKYGHGTTRYKTSKGCIVCNRVKRRERRAERAKSAAPKPTGNDLFYDGKPCKNCQGTRRYKSINSCVACMARHSSKWHAENYEPNPRERLVIPDDGLKTYQGKPCRYGHDGTRWKSTRACVACAGKAAAEWAKQKAANDDEWRKARNEKMRLPSIARSRRLWQEDRQRQINRVMDYWRRNPDKRRELVSARRARRKNAMPAWANTRAIAAIYKEAVRVSQETGVPHHVDHIVPLAGRNVCGLHVETNLRVIPADMNRRKGNRLPAE